MLKIYITHHILVLTMSQCDLIYYFKLAFKNLQQLLPSYIWDVDNISLGLLGEVHLSQFMQAIYLERLL